MRSKTALFYQYSAAHSFLIGLLPFFLPALIWQRELSLNSIAWFIALSGAGYVVGLYCWDRFRERYGLGSLVAISFPFEIGLVSAVVADTSLDMINIIALLNGVYGCFFWMAQRLLFIQCTDSNNTGKKFGNFQIIVMIVLKVGILAGGYLWEQHGAVSVFLASAIINVPLMFYFFCRRENLASESNQNHAISISDTLQFRDKKHSRPIFLFDGLFLFAESYFWVISLYFISGQNLLKLGVLVISLSIILSVIFYLIKNALDKMPHQIIYSTAVIAYLLSWLLRGSINTDQSMLWIYSGIVVVAFLTAFFRLAFNKRFFDLAREGDHVRYIVIKSYWSQFGIFAFFAIVALTLMSTFEPSQSLKLFYWVLAPISLIYFLYRAPRTDR